MKWIKRIIFALLIIIALGAVLVWALIGSLKPEYDEKIVLPGLNDQVSVSYDTYAIPHIYANSLKDAYYALGYVHAKERLWQMEIYRRIGPGRLSEIFGEIALESDRFYRTIGIDKFARLSAERFRKSGPETVRQLVNAYLNGVNQFIEVGKTPLEYTILQVDKTPFTLEDIFYVGDYMAFSFAMAHKTEPLLSYILSHLGQAYLEDLNVHVDSATVLINNHWVSENFRDLSLHVQDLLMDTPVPPMIGSNSWVIGPSKTKSGKPILANDPHIGFSQPAVWFEAHLETPEFPLYGNWLAGYPFPQIGHTDHHAIGLTMFENDDIDLFREIADPSDSTRYLFKGSSIPFQVRTEKIRVKGQDNYNLIVRETGHGPVLSDVLETTQKDELLSMWWTQQKFPNDLLQASYELIHARSLDEARQGVKRIHAPGLNVMYADINGNIAWWAAAKLPIRPPHVNSKLILDGSTGEDDVIGFLDFKDNPQAENPPWGYVYSANNQPSPVNGHLYPGYYLPEDRARRIVKLLEAHDSWDVDGVKEMLLDVTSDNVPEIIVALSREVDRQVLTPKEVNILDKLLAWNGEYRSSSSEAIVYTKWIYLILEKGLKDELGELFQLFNGTHVMKRSIQPLLGNPESIWWDDQDTDKIEKGREIFTEALQLACAQLDEQLGKDETAWQWSNVHLLQHNHALGSLPWLSSYLNVGPFGSPGATEVINNLQFKMNGEGVYQVHSGPSCRRIVDFSDFRLNSWSVLPTGQSGHPMSPHYRDQAEMYVQGTFRRQLMDRHAIRNNVQYTSIFSPD